MNVSTFFHIATVYSAEVSYLTLLSYAFGDLEAVSYISCFCMHVLQNSKRKELKISRASFSDA